MTDHTCTPVCDGVGAALCPRSPKYWRRAENRADGQPYRLATLEEAYASVSDERQ